MTLTELNFDTDFFEMGLLADANKEKGEGRKMRNRSKRKCQRRELSYLRKSTRKRTVMQMDTIRFQCKKPLTLLDCARMDRLVSTMTVSRFYDNVECYRYLSYCT
jgi:hypothetical protein